MCARAREHVGICVYLSPIQEMRLDGLATEEGAQERRKGRWKKLSRGPRIPCGTVSRGKPRSTVPMLVGSSTRSAQFRARSGLVRSGSLPSVALLLYEASTREVPSFPEQGYAIASKCVAMLRATVAQSVTTGAKLSVATPLQFSPLSIHGALHWLEGLAVLVPAITEAVLPKPQRCEAQRGRLIVVGECWPARTLHAVSGASVSLRRNRPV